MKKNNEIIIINSGSGNFLSIKRAFEKCGANTKISNDLKEIIDAQKLVLPGVGAFKKTMDKLNKINIDKIVIEIIKRKTPLLGICLGMQLLFDESEEFGINKGLGIIKGKIKKIPSNDLVKYNLKIPSIGWRKLNFKTSNDQKNYEYIFKQTDENSKYYFIHSFYAVPEEDRSILAYYNFGNIKIPAVVRKDNVIGCQFHPEKSGNDGLSLIKNFIAYLRN